MLLMKFGAVIEDSLSYKDQFYFTPLKCSIATNRTHLNVSTVTTRNTVELPLSSHLLIHQVHHDVHFRHIGLLSKTDLFCFITSSRDQPAQNFLRFSDFFYIGQFVHNYLCQTNLTSKTPNRKWGHVSEILFHANTKFGIYILYI